MAAKTLQDMIAHGLSDEAIAEHGRTLTRFVIEVGSERIGPGVDGDFATLRIYPEGFEYKAETFGIDNNTLYTREELDAKKQFLVNEARAVLEVSQKPVTTGAKAE